MQQEQPQAAAPAGAGAAAQTVVGDAPAARRRRLLARCASGLLLICGAVALYLHLDHYLPFLSDDALISLRYARRLVAGAGLTWTDGERVEGYTNLLWTLACAGLHACGLDPIVAARALGFAGMMAGFAALLYTATRPGREGLAAAALAGAGWVLAGPVAIWAIGGLEQPLFAGLLAWALVLLRPLAEAGPAASAGPWPAPAGRLAAIGALLAALALTRADGALGVGGVLAGLLLARGPTRRASWTLVLALAALPLLAVVAQLVFRLGYYGQWLPNTALAKVALGWPRFLAGLAYVGQGLLPWVFALPALVVAAARARRDPARRRWGTLLLVSAATWAAYVALIGGDIFPGWRQLVPLLPPLALGVLAGAPRPVPGRRHWLATGLALLLLAGFAVGQRLDPRNHQAVLERFEWTARTVGLCLDRAFGPQRPLLAVDAAGSLPYWSGLPSLDLLGLNDSWLAHHPPAGFGRGTLGHELGNGAYVLRRRPDLLLFNGARGGARPNYRSGRELVASPEFHQQYRLVQLRCGRGASVKLWARQEGGPLGVRRLGDEVRVPAWLAATGADGLARLDRHGRPHGLARLAAPLTLRGLSLPAGVWQVRSEPPQDGLDWVVRTGGATPSSPPLARAQAASALALPLAAPTTIDLSVAPTVGDGTRWLRELVFRRAQGG